MHGKTRHTQLTHTYTHTNIHTHLAHTHTHTHTSHIHTHLTHNSHTLTHTHTHVCALPTQGQQDRLERGGDTWGNPVSYDKMAVRYRRWRNQVAAGDEAATTAASASTTLTAGELFAIEQAADSVFIDQ